jgi:hypothetical protein
MTKLIVSVVLLFAVAAQAQQHAPTKAQCDPDLNLWRAGLITDAQGGLSLRDDAKIGFFEIVKRAGEMADCEAAHMPRENLGSGPYAELGKILDSILETRLIAFMKRHPDSFKQFAEEDAAGLR